MSRFRTQCADSRGSQSRNFNGMGSHLLGLPDLIQAPWGVSSDLITSRLMRGNASASTGPTDAHAQHASEKRCAGIIANAEASPVVALAGRSLHDC